MSLTITGDVQGVGFRWSALKKATALGLHLHRAQNLPDGSVEFIAEGEETALQKFAEWAHSGPELAKVENVSVQRLTD